VGRQTRVGWGTGENIHFLAVKRQYPGDTSTVTIND